MANNHTNSTIKQVKLKKSQPEFRNQNPALFFGKSFRTEITINIVQPII